jgi:hypothetical protein
MLDLLLISHDIRAALGYRGTSQSVLGALAVRIV